MFFIRTGYASASRCKSSEGKPSEGSDLLIILSLCLPRELTWTVVKDRNQLRGTKDHILSLANLNNFGYFVIVIHGTFLLSSELGVFAL